MFGIYSKKQRAEKQQQLAFCIAARGTTSELGLNNRINISTPRSIQTGLYNRNVII